MILVCRLLQLAADVQTCMCFTPKVTAAVSSLHGISTRCRYQFMLDGDYTNSCFAPQHDEAPCTHACMCMKTPVDNSDDRTHTLTKAATVQSQHSSIQCLHVFSFTPSCRPGTGHEHQQLTGCPH